MVGIATVRAHVVDGAERWRRRPAKEVVWVSCRTYRKTTVRPSTHRHMRLAHPVTHSLALGRAPTASYLTPGSNDVRVCFPTRATLHRRRPMLRLWTWDGPYRW